MIKDYRKKHIFAVAELLKKYAIENNFKQKDVEALYTLGLVHDIGYEFLDEKDFEKHEVVGGGC